MTDVTYVVMKRRNWIYHARPLGVVSGGYVSFDITLANEKQEGFLDDGDSRGRL